MEKDSSNQSNSTPLNDITALNQMFFFIETAQKRGVYSLEESAQIWEVFKYFKTKFDDKK